MKKRQLEYKFDHREHRDQRPSNAEVRKARKSTGAQVSLYLGAGVESSRLVVNGQAPFYLKNEHQIEAAWGVIKNVLFGSGVKNV